MYLMTKSSRSATKADKRYFSAAKRKRRKRGCILLKGNTCECFNDSILYK